MSVRPFYDRWPQYNRRLTQIVGAMSDKQLAINPGPDADRWSIWATVAHTASARLYWLCNVLGEPGAEATPWPDLPDDGWEDDLDHPRHADELVWALDSTFAVVERVLDRQAQEAASPYLALWSRVAAFDPGELHRAFADQRIVKAQLFRITLHA